VRPQKSQRSPTKNPKPVKKKSNHTSFEVRVRGMHYDPTFVSPRDREEVFTWLKTLNPIWEERFSKNNPPPQGQPNRSLLRPVYWLGNWQFACLDYYHPPQGIENRCVRAEPYPKVLARWVFEIEQLVRNIYPAADIPQRWRLNTCLINFYGTRIDPITGKREDSARVGEHKDFEPGPVASVSFGERALIQFVSSSRIGTRDGVVFQQWLDDSALQIFGGSRWKRETFHRVQRVENKLKTLLPPQIENFETRRINFTFRYVPEEHIVRYCNLPAPQAEDVSQYMQQLGTHSSFFKEELDARPGSSETLHP